MYNDTYGGTEDAEDRPGKKSGEKAFKVTSQFKGKCRICGKPGHMAKDCWNKEGGGKNPHFQKKTQDGGNGGSGGFKRFHTPKGDGGMKCFYCQKIGHMKKDCRKRIADEKNGKTGDRANKVEGKTRGEVAFCVRDPEITEREWKERAKNAMDRVGGWGDDESEDGEDSSVNEIGAESLDESSHDGVPCHMGCRSLSLLGLGPGLGHVVCTPCRNLDGSVIQDAVSALTEVALATLLDHVDGIEESDARVGGEDLAEGLITSFRGLDEGTPVSIIPINQELPETLNKGATNSFYEWVKKTKEEIEKIESGSSSDEDSKVNVPEDIHISSTEWAPQLGLTLDQYNVAYLRKQGSVDSFQNSGSESDSDDDEPPPLLLTRVWQCESSSDEETDDEGMVAIAWPRAKPMYGCLTKSEPCPKVASNSDSRSSGKGSGIPVNGQKGISEKYSDGSRSPMTRVQSTTFETSRDKNSIRGPSGLRNREVNIDKLEGTKGFSNHFSFRKRSESITDNHGRGKAFHGRKRGGIRQILRTIRFPVFSVDIDRELVHDGKFRE